MPPNDSVSIINVQYVHGIEITNESEICFQVYFGERNRKTKRKINCCQRYVICQNQKVKD
jgi:hypothetical protein